jgi:tol-pal system protein YbgF
VKRLIALAAALALLTAAPLRAANKDMERLQVQIAVLQGQLAELQRSTEASRGELRRLGELVAEQNALLKKDAQDQRTYEEAMMTALKDVTDRLAEVAEQFQSLRATGVPPAEGSPADVGAGTSPAGPPPAPRELYQQAYADFARGNYDLAVQAFQEYLKSYPETDYTDNAQYWIGECLYGKKAFDQAIEAWNVLLRDYPSSDKIPDARMKKGMAFEKLGRRSQALVEYRYVVDRFPNTTAARLAKERLSP